MLVEGGMCNVHMYMGRMAFCSSSTSSRKVMIMRNKEKKIKEETSKNIIEVSPCLSHQGEIIIEKIKSKKEIDLSIRDWEAERFIVTH